MKNFLLYGHGGAYNRGAEAIAQTTLDMIRAKYPCARVLLSSHFPEQDEACLLGFDGIIRPDADAFGRDKACAPQSEKRALARAMYAEALAQIGADTVLLSVGGDNYCYGNWHRLAVFQERANAAGAKSVLWGASVEPGAITPEMSGALGSHTVIAARESLTFEALAARGFQNTSLILAPDPAFALEPKEFPLPEWPGPVIGVNISPLLICREARPGVITENIRALIRHITAGMGCIALLIPHVVMPADDDFTLLRELCSSLPKEERGKTFLLGPGHSAAGLKYAISRCAALVCARTHASIAAYSQGVPALVLGYSVKSRGIARDLGVGEYVLGVADITGANDVLNAFAALWEARESVRGTLEGRLPGYRERLIKLAGAL